MIFVIFFVFSTYWLTGMLLVLVISKSTKKIQKSICHPHFVPEEKSKDHKSQQVSYPSMFFYISVWNKVADQSANAAISHSRATFLYPNNSFR